MKKVVYVTSDFFLDTDFPVVKELNGYYDFAWIVFYKVSDKHTVTIDEINNYAQINNINLTIYNVTSRFRSFKQLSMVYKLTKELKNLNAHIYYFQPFSDPYFPFFVRFLLDIKRTIIAVHDVVPHTKFRSLISRTVDKFSLSMFKNYHFFSRTQEALYRQKHEGKRTLVTSMFLKNFGPAPVIERGEKVNFLFFGMIRYNKGLDYLIKAANLLAKEYKNFIITIAGKCEDFKPYADIIENKDIFDLQIRIIPNEEIPALFARADYLVLPYRDVTQSGPLLISYNYRVPVIASDFPGFREYIYPNNTGYLFEPCKEEKLYEVMKGILTSSVEVKQAIKTRLNCYIEDEISIKKIISRYLSFFENI